MAQTVWNSVGRYAFKLFYEISPIVLTGQSVITSWAPMNLLPIVAMTEPASFATGILANNTGKLDLDNFLCHWQPLPGYTIYEATVGEYPMANQAVAANAIITQELRISLLMRCPARAGAGYLTKLATLMLMQYMLKKHSNSGGTYTVLTPAMLYTNCILRTIRDVSVSDSRQPQIEWQFDFTQPLITEAAAGGVLDTLLTRINNNVFTDGATSGTAPAASSGFGPAIQPSANVAAAVPYQPMPGDAHAPWQW
jgi:hypothetical protein